jgi:hypothetical protein
MALSAGDRRDLDAYAAEIGSQAVQCRITRKHDYHDVLEYDGINLNRVDIRFDPATNSRVVDCYCKRGCGAKQTQFVDRFNGMLTDKSETKYTNKAYLRPSGHTGYSGMGRAEIGYLRVQRINTALARAKDIQAARRTEKKKK